MDHSPDVDDAIEGLRGSRFCPRGLCLMQDGRYRCACSSFHPGDFRLRTLQEMTRAGARYPPMTEGPYPHDMELCPHRKCLTVELGTDCLCAKEDEEEEDEERDLNPTGGPLDNPAGQGSNEPTQGTTSNVPEASQRMTRARARALREAEGASSNAGLEGARYASGRDGEVDPREQLRQEPSQRRQRGDQEQGDSAPQNGGDPLRSLRRVNAAEARRLATKKACEQRLSKLRKVVNVCLAMLYFVSTFLRYIVHCVNHVARVTKDYLSPCPYIVKVVEWLRPRLFNVGTGDAETD